MHAIILAGGKGTRLSGVFDGPKALAPIRGKPFIKHQLDWLSSQGIRKVTLSVGHKADEIAAEVGERYGDIEVNYVVERVLLGTGGALRVALGTVEKFPVFAFNGDTFLDLNLNAMLERHQALCPPLTVALKLVQGRGYINCGAYIFSSNVLSGEPLKFSFEEYLGKARPPGFVMEGELVDIGEPESYFRCRGGVIS